MKKILSVVLIFVLTITMSACKDDSNSNPKNPTDNICETNPEHEDCEGNNQTPTVDDYYYCKDLDDDCFNLVEGFINTMTLREKAGQMVQGERGNVSSSDLAEYNLGSLLSGGGSHPNGYKSSVDDWFNMYKSYQQSALGSSTGIPIIYGIDAVHGNNNLYGATIFPHNIGLGATNDKDLMYEIGKVTAEEMLVTGINWNFAPAMSVVQDIRWGRSYEGFSENPDDHGVLAASIIQGMQDNGVSATAKHFLGDGGTDNGIDRGNTIGNETEIRERYLAPYIDSIEAGVDAVMISYSSINGVKMHGSKYWITDVLKEELGFEGFIISDWQAIHELPGSFNQQIVQSINAGVDMLMEPTRWKNAVEGIEYGVTNNDISLERIDDAVRRILSVKYYRGLFDNPYYKIDESNLGNEAHLALAREAVRKSLVLLQNDNDSLPLEKTEKIYITGPGANSVALQSGGWSTYWQGAYSDFFSWNYDFLDNNELGSGIGISDAVTEVLSNTSGTLVSSPEQADTIIIVLAENAYAEGFGDNNQMTLTTGNAHSGNQLALQLAQQYNSTKNVVGILLSGRPLLLENHLDNFDSFIAAWLPGSEGGHGISDVIFGDFNFTGNLTFTWPVDYSQIGYNYNDKNYDPSTVLFPYGYGLTY